MTMAQERKGRSRIHGHLGLHLCCNHLDAVNAGPGCLPSGGTRQTIFLLRAPAGKSVFILYLGPRLDREESARERRNRMQYALSRRYSGCRLLRQQQQQWGLTPVNDLADYGRKVLVLHLGDYRTAAMVVQVEAA